MPRKKGKLSPGHPFAPLEKLRAELGEPERPSPSKPGLPSRDELVDREEEELAMHRLMAGVTPLRDQPTRIPRTLDAPPRGTRGKAVKEVQASAEKEADEVMAHLRSLVEGARFEVNDDGSRVEGRRVDLPPDVLRALRHGRIPIDARLDLHGLGAGEARTALDGFLADKRAKGEKCVLVIHGKGAHSPRGAGVLRGEIAAWLSQGAASAHVAAFSTATKDDGGEGAVYVLLRR